MNNFGQFSIASNDRAKINLIINSHLNKVRQLKAGYKCVYYTPRIDVILLSQGLNMTLRGAFTRNCQIVFKQSRQIVRVVKVDPYSLIKNKTGVGHSRYTITSTIQFAVRRKLILINQ